MIGKTVKQKYLHHVVTIKNSLEKINRNTVTESEVRDIIGILEGELNYRQDNQNLCGDQLVDYMYKLTQQYFQVYKQEIGSKPVISNQKQRSLNDETKQSIIENDEKKDRLLINITKYPRDFELSRRVLENSNYCCEIDPSHRYFTSFSTKQNYVEAHHIIPLQFQEQFEKCLDIEANMVSLCVVCHKKLHHAIFEQKKEVLATIFQARKEHLKNCEINMTLEQLYEMYNFN